MYTIQELLNFAATAKASDVHLTVGIPPMMRVNGKLHALQADKLLPKDTEAYARSVLKEDQYEKYKEVGEMDFSYAMPGVSRFRVNIFRQRGSDALALRTIPINVPTLESLNMPEVIRGLTDKTRGLVLVTGPTGSGKSTTLAAMINEINHTQNSHIITLEDPIEYLHRHNTCIVNQREVGNDTMSYANALRAALREDPDVILVGEMRDLETISIAVTAAETGHLVFSTLHTIGASKTIDRIVDVFPPYQQQQIRVQLASVFEGVISQQLIPLKDGSGRTAALEIMVANPAIRNLIREGKTHQIDSSIQTGAKSGMRTMDSSIAELYKQGLISRDDAMTYAVDRELLDRIISIG